MANSLWRIEEGRLHLSLHPGQARAWQSEARFVAIIAGTQSGKTSFLPWWLWREILRCGPGDYIAATASFDLFKLKFLPAIREVFEHILRCGRYWAGDRVIELADPEGKFLAKQSSDPMWGRIILRSAAAGGGLESTTAQAALLDEAGQDQFGVEDWEAVLRRLSLSRGRVLLGTTPYNVGWLKAEVFDRWTAGDLNYEVIQFASTENPMFPPEEYERAKATMPAWRFAMMYQGLFSRPAGMIYDCYSEDLHLCDPIPIPAHWPVYLGVDFGGANTALLWLAEEPGTGRLFVWEESLTGGKSTRQHVAEALEKAQGRNLVAAWGGAPGEEQQRWDWAVEGLEVLRPPVGDVEAGIDRVTELLKAKRVKIFKGLRGLRDEIGSYRRKLDKQGQPTEEIEDKRKYHRLDSFRYVAAGLVNAPVGVLPVGALGQTRRRD
jgi:hypothetical protein